MQFLHSFRRIAQNYAETVPFHIIPTPGNYGIFCSVGKNFFDTFFFEKKCQSLMTSLLTSPIF